MAEKFESRTSANTAKPTHEAQLKAICEIAEAAGFEVPPVAREKVAIVGGALRAANFRSTNSYLVRHGRARVEAGFPLSDALLVVLRLARKPATRGAGATRKAAFFDVELIAKLLVVEQPAVAGGPRYPRGFIIVGAWWLLREIEASLVRLG